MYYFHISKYVCEALVPLQGLFYIYGRKRKEEYKPFDVICIFTCTYIQYYIHTYIHTHIHKYTHTYLHTYIHICMHADTHTLSHIHTYIHACTHTHPHTCIHTYIHTIIHTYIHTYIHTNIHTYISSFIQQTCRYHSQIDTNCVSSFHIRLLNTGILTPCHFKILLWCLDKLSKITSNWVAEIHCRLAYLSC